MPVPMIIVMGLSPRTKISTTEEPQEPLAKRARTSEAQVDPEIVSAGKKPRDVAGLVYLNIYGNYTVVFFMYGGYE